MTDTAIPDYCAYTRGVCSDPNAGSPTDAFFVYPSEPKVIAETIRQAISVAQRESSLQLMSWEDLGIAGQIIFCEVCKAISASKVVVANITTLNFNVMFELGFAIGKGKPVIPVRDITYSRDKELFEQLGIFDVVGYEEFQGSDELTQIAKRVAQARPIKVSPTKLSRAEPTYIVRAPYNLDASARLIAAVKKSALYRFRAFDRDESPRLSLYEAYRQVSMSFGTIVHMIDPNREGSTAHNALCAFVAGISCALGRRTLMLQEEFTRHPIDYRELIVPYDTTRTVTAAVQEFVRDVADAINTESPRVIESSQLLERVDIGDTAAENEISSLNRYFVQTPQYQQTRKGHARLVVGRKGSGKTAIFFTLRDALKSSNTLVLDLKPDGHHFTKLREEVLDQMREGTQLHTLIAFWSYILLLELARKVLQRASRTAWNDPDSLAQYRELEKEYTAHCLIEGGDFSERIMALADNITSSFTGAKDGRLSSGEVTQLVYQCDIAKLRDLVVTLLGKRDEVWLLFDNIDKGWSSGGATAADIAVVRSLLEATRKLQRELQRAGSDFKSVVFIRQDIYDLLADQTPDRGKESVANLDWLDEALLEEMLRKRFQATEELNGDFRSIWSQVFAAHVGGEESFRYIVLRSLYQPRAVLNFVTKAIHVAASHGHNFVSEDDITTAERAFSEDMLDSLRLEIRDVYPQYGKLLHGFVGYSSSVYYEDIELIADQAELPPDSIDHLVRTLLWFSFLGVVVGDKVRYSYETMYDLHKLDAFHRGIERAKREFQVHPAFLKALELEKS